MRDNFGGLLKSYGEKYGSINDKLIGKLEQFFRDDRDTNDHRVKPLISKDAYSYRILGNSAPGGPRVVFAKDNDDAYIPIFVGNHKEYDRYLDGNKIDLQIEEVQAGRSVVDLETDDYKRSEEKMKLDPVPRDNLEFTDYSTAHEGRYITCKSMNLCFSEAQLAVFESVSFDMDIESIDDSLLKRAMDDLQTAKSFVMESSPSTLKENVEVFQDVYGEIQRDPDTRSKVFDHLGVKKEWPECRAYDNRAKPIQANITEAANSIVNVGSMIGEQTILLMVDFQESARDIVFADHLLGSGVSANDDIYDDVKEFNLG